MPSVERKAAAPGPGAGLGPMPWQSWKGTDRVRRWEMFCRKYVNIPHGHGAGEPMTIYPPQRRIRQAIDDHVVSVWSVAKGNTKSSTAAPIGLHWIADPPPGDREPLVIVVSGSKEQARSGVYDTAVSMVRSSPVLSACFVVYESLERPRIECPQTGGVLRPLAPTPRRLHGVIPSLSLVDEVGLIHDERVSKTMIQSVGKRPGSRVFMFGTPGWERGEMWRMRQQWVKGELAGAIHWEEWAAPPDADIDDRAVWADANPMRAALNPDDWAMYLEAARVGTTEDEFRIFHLGQWPEMTGTKLVSSERWAELANPTLDGTPPLRFVAVEGDYSRRNVAVVSVDAYDGHAHLTLEAIWEHQTDPVPIGDILDAVLAPGPVNLAVLRAAGQLDDLELELHAEGVPTERLETHSAAKMRGPTDQWLEAVTEGTLSHDDAEPMRRQIGNTRLEPRREGLTITRDERAATEEAARIDAPIAAIVAVHKARTVPAPAIY